MVKSILIIGHRGRLRDGLRAILLAHEGIDEVMAAPDFAAALGHITHDYPSLVIIDGSDQIGEHCKTIKQFFLLQGRKPCLVIADSLKQRENAKNAGANAVLMQGFTTTALYEALEDLLFVTNLAGNQTTSTAQRSAFNPAL